MFVSWFCHDGTVQPPKAYACVPHGGGVQYGVLSDSARKLAAESSIDRGIALLEGLRPTLGATEWGLVLDEEIGRIEDLAREARDRLEGEVDALVSEGKLRAAIAVLDEAPPEKAGGLADYIEHERDRLQLLLDR